MSQSLIKFRYVAFFLSGILTWKIQAVNLASAPNGVDSAYYSSYIANGDLMNDFFPTNFNYFWTRAVPIMVGRQFHLLFGSIDGYSLLRLILIGLTSLAVCETSFQISRKIYPSFATGIVVVGLPIAPYVITNDYVAFMSWPLFVIAICLLAIQPFLHRSSTFVAAGASIGLLISLILFSYPAPLPVLAVSALVSISFSLVYGRHIKIVFAMVLSLLLTFVASNVLVSKLATISYGAEDLLFSSFQWMIQISKSQAIADYFHTASLVWIPGATSLAVLAVGLVLAASICFVKQVTFDSLNFSTSYLNVLSAMILATGSFVAIQQFLIGRGVLEIAISVTYVLVPTLLLIATLSANASTSIKNLLIVCVGIACVPYVPKIIFPLIPIGIAISAMIAINILISLSKKTPTTISSIQAAFSLIGITFLLYGHTSSIAPGAANIAGPNYKVGYLDSTYLLDREIGVLATDQILQGLDSNRHLLVWLQPGSGEEATQVASSFLWGNAEHSLREGVESLGPKDIIRIKSFDTPVLLVVVAKTTYAQELITKELSSQRIKYQEPKCFSESNTKFCGILIN